jgi:hypothetical protein
LWLAGACPASLAHSIWVTESAACPPVAISN